MAIMRRRLLGRTGLEVSEIGLGAWGLGGGIWKGVPEEEMRGAVLAAVEEGINFIDTALVYGEGSSEQLIGAVLDQSDSRHRVILASKIPPMDRTWPGLATTPLREVFPPSHVVSSVERSLINLNAGFLDLMQLHVWNDAWLEDPLWDETRRMMETLRDDGRVRHWGVSVNSHDPDSALRILEDPLVESAQVIYNIFDRSPERGFFDRARKNRTGLIVRVPFDEGTLTGSVDAGTVFEEGDFRARYFAGDRKKEAEDRAAALEALLGDEAATLPELALRFCLHRPEVGTVIPGMRRAAHVRANAAVSDGRTLSREMLHRLREHAWEKNWYSGSRAAFGGVDGI